jgi:hypothetical protein
MPTCPFRSIGTNGTCLPCSSSCGTCSTPLDSGACTSCPSDRPVLHNARCLDHCPRMMYYDGITCSRCDTSCASCLGGTSSSCSSCPEGLLLEGGKCVSPSAKCISVPGLGVCLKVLADKENKAWLWFIALPFVLGILGVLGWMYIRAQRRKRRAEIKKFGDAMDQVARRQGEEGEGTVRLRLEKVLGLNRIRVEGEEADKRRNLRELLLPRRTKPTDIPLETKKSGYDDTSSHGIAPPPYSSDPDPEPAKRGEERLIRQSRIMDMSTPLPLFTEAGSSSASAPGSGSGPRPPPRHLRTASYQVPIEGREKQTVRCGGLGEKDRLDELWPAMGERKEIEGWV